MRCKYVCHLAVWISSRLAVDDWRPMPQRCLLLVPRPCAATRAYTGRSKHSNCRLPSDMAESGPRTQNRHVWKPEATAMWSSRGIRSPCVFSGARRRRAARASRLTPMQIKAQHIPRSRFQEERISLQVLSMPLLVVVLSRRRRRWQHGSLLLLRLLPFRGSTGRRPAATTRLWWRRRLQVRFR